jgi:hypothetical protein
VQLQIIIIIIIIIINLKREEDKRTKKERNSIECWWRVVSQTFSGQKARNVVL